MALDDFLETVRSIRQRSEADAQAVVEAVLHSAASLRGGVTPGRTLPEFGDEAVREVVVATPVQAFRILFERRGAEVRVLWVTNNLTCYRNRQQTTQAGALENVSDRITMQ